MSTSRRRASDDAYLRQVEKLAHAAVEKAADEGWLTFLPEDEDQTPLQRSINELARSLRFVHDDGDGCVDD